MDDTNCAPSGFKLKDTGFDYTLSVLGGKYKMTLLYWLSEYKVMRFNEPSGESDPYPLKPYPSC